MGYCLNKQAVNARRTLDEYIAEHASKPTWDPIKVKTLFDNLALASTEAWERDRALSALNRRLLTLPDVPKTQKPLNRKQRRSMKFVKTQKVQRINGIYDNGVW